MGTVGLLEVKPGSPNVVPGEVYFTIDMRDPDPAVLDGMEGEVTAAAKKLESELGLQIGIKNIWMQPPTRVQRRLHRRGARGRARLRLSAPAT